MSRTLTFHPLVQKDLNEILAYYETEASLEIADQFEQELHAAIASIKENPYGTFHSTSISGVIDAVAFPRFPI